MLKPRQGTPGAPDFFQWAHAELEQQIADEISVDELWRHVERFAKLDRLTGMPGEAEAARYIEGCLKSYGLAPVVHRFEAYVSHPKESHLSLYAPVQEEIECVGQSFSASTQPGGICGELAYLAASALEGQEQTDVRGKIVLTDVPLLLRPSMARLVEAEGAIGHIHIDSETIPRVMAATPVWGTPTTSSADLVPRIPSVCIGKESGQRLIELSQCHATSASLSTRVWTGWLQVPLPVVEIPGTEEPDTYVLVGGHFDAWYVGVTDNGTGNALMLELARVLSKYREYLRVGVKIAWWPCHSQGRYAGSTWYVDTFWDDLNRNALVYFNVDSPGMRGATMYAARQMAELELFNTKNVEDITGIPLSQIGDQARELMSSRRPSRAGDQSFMGIGIPSLAIYSFIPVDSDEKVAEPGPSWGWWLHTVHDTIDKADRDLLVRDTELRLLLVWRLCNSFILPFDHTAAADDLTALLQSLQSKDVFDLQRSLEEVARLKDDIADLKNAARRILNLYQVEQGEEKEQARSAMRVINQCLVDVSRSLVPVTYTLAGRYAQDPATATPLLPGLAAINKLASLYPHSDAYRFAQAELKREHNRLLHSLSLARQSIQNCLVNLGGDWRQGQSIP